MQKRQIELTKLFRRLCEDSVPGRIFSQEYTTEQKEIQEQLPAMEARLQELKDASTNIIKRVAVGEREEKYSRTAPQEIRIYYRDIGLVDELPQSATAGEVA